VARHTIKLCVGSACHQLGVYRVLPELERLLEERGHKADVQLKGAFCLGPCADGIVLDVDGVVVSHITPDNIRTKFLEEIEPCLK
jgi:NADH:ubiquinone oxidoreductase subunit E